MLFRKDIENRCAYCALSGKIDDEQVICRRRGIVDAASSCRHFSYDPLKRVPPKRRAVPLTQYDDADFSL